MLIGFPFLPLKYLSPTLGEMVMSQDMSKPWHPGYPKIAGSWMVIPQNMVQ